MRLSRALAARVPKSPPSAMSPPTHFTMAPVGYMESPLRKNGSPKQGSLAHLVRGALTLSTGCPNAEHALAGLAAYSHIWLLWVAHTNRGEGLLRNTVKVPVLGGERMGLWATRTPHRPNPLMMTLCRLDRVQGATIWVSGHDLIHGTPVLDVKPYLPDADSAPAARGPAWRTTAAPAVSVAWAPVALASLERIALRFYAPSEFRATVEQLLQLNPRSQSWAKSFGSFYYLRFDRAYLQLAYTDDGGAVCVQSVTECELEDK